MPASRTEKLHTFALIIGEGWVFKIVLFVVRCAVSILVRAVTIFVFGADFVLRVIVPRVVLRYKCQGG
jgi:hypothetical protein